MQNITKLKELQESLKKHISALKRITEASGKKQLSKEAAKPHNDLLSLMAGELKILEHFISAISHEEKSSMIPSSKTKEGEEDNDDFEEISTKEIEEINKEMQPKPLPNTTKPKSSYNYITLEPRPPLVIEVPNFLSLLTDEPVETKKPTTQINKSNSNSNSSKGLFGWFNRPKKVTSEAPPVTVEQKGNLQKQNFITYCTMHRDMYFQKFENVPKENLCRLKYNPEYQNYLAFDILVSQLNPKLADSKAKLSMVQDSAFSTLLTQFPVIQMYQQCWPQALNEFAAKHPGLLPPVHQEIEIVRKEEKLTKQDFKKFCEERYGFHFNNPWMSGMNESFSGHNHKLYVAYGYLENELKRELGEPSRNHGLDYTVMNVLLDGPKTYGIDKYRHIWPEKLKKLDEERQHAKNQSKTENTRQYS